MDQYNQSNTIYIFTPDLGTYIKSRAFEKQSFIYIPLEQIATISGKYQLYKIVK